MRAVFLDLSLGGLAYVILTVAFGHEQSLFWLGVALVASLGPDYDLLIFGILRKFRRMVSHHLIHYPAVVVILLVVTRYISHDWYTNSIVTVPMFLHLAHDLCGDGSLALGWPLFPDTYYRFKLQEWQLVRETGAERAIRAEALHGHEVKQGFVRMLRSRLKKDWQENGRSAIAFELFVVCILIGFLYHPLASLF